MSDLFGILFGLYLSFFGIKTLRRSILLRRRGHFSIGTVSRFTFPRNLFVSFLTSKDQPFEFKAEGGSPWSYKVGDQVAVLYDPLKPGNANIFTWDHLWSSAVTYLGFGLIILLATLYQMLTR